MNSIVLYLITVSIWGSTWLAIRLQLGNVAPELSIAYRLILAAAILLIYIRVRGLPLRYSLRQHAYIALQAVFLFSLNYFLIYLAEGYLASGLVAIAFSTIIFLNVIFGALILRNPVRPTVLFGGILGVMGLALVFWPQLQASNFSRGMFLGLAFAIAGTILASLGNIVSARNQRAGLPVVQTNGIGMAYGAVIMLGVSLLGGGGPAFEPSVGYAVSLVYLALFGSVIAFGSYLTLLGRIGSDRAAYVTIIFPIVALALSTLFEGLTWNFVQVAGVALALVGNLFVLGRFRRRRSLRLSAATASD